MTLTLWIVIITIIISTLASLFFMIKAFITSDSELKLMSVVMLFTPPVGVICHIGQYLIRTLSRKPKEIPLDEVGFSKERHGRLIEPDKETEMQKVPLEELFLISTDVEKRKHLLNELKKETAINYGTITKALDNEDPESAHYAAAALANVKAEYENELRDYDNRYNRNNENTKLCREYAGRTRDFLDSGILTGIELKRYNYLIINLLSGIPQNGGTLNNDDYVSIVKSAIFNGEYEIAKKWALECHELLPSEISFLHLLKIYYDTGLTENFFSILDDLKKSEVSLTEEGLNLVRYFLRPVQV